MSRPLERINGWIAEPVQWSEVRAIAALPAVLVAGFWIFLISLIFVLWLVGPMIVVGLPGLTICQAIIGALALAWIDLWRKGKGRRLGRSMRIGCALVLGLWLVAEWMRFTMLTGPPLVWGFVLKWFNSGGAAYIYGQLLTRTFEWTTVIATLWLLTELLLPTTNRSDRAPARGWGFASWLVVLMVFVMIGQHQVDNYRASPESLVDRAQGPGTVGEALCRGDFATADHRLESSSVALKDDELLWVMSGCARLLIHPATSAENKRLRIRLLGSLARLVTARRMGSQSGLVCSEAAESIVLSMYTGALMPEYLASVREGGIAIDCLMRDDYEGMKSGMPVWWHAVIDEGTVRPRDSGNRDDGYGDAEEGKQRLATLKRLGIRFAQKDTHGHDLLSRVDGWTTNAWIEALVDEGLIADTDLRLRLLYRRFGVSTDEASGDMDEAARLSARVGEPSVVDLKQAMRGTASEAVRKASDEKGARFLAWVVERIGHDDARDALLQGQIGDDVGPEVRGIIDDLWAEKTAENLRKRAHQRAPSRAIHSSTTRSGISSGNAPLSSTTL